MEPTFSEFSYGYALTEELASGRLRPLAGAPVFPSLYQEGQPGGGYDLKLPMEGAPLFLQFKLSEYLWRSNAKDRDLFVGPYFRMFLRASRHSNQHQLLMDLELANPEMVYYVAPLFHTAGELNTAYLSKSVFYRSVLIAPSAIGGLPDDGSHYIAFTDSEPTAYLRSDDFRTVERFRSGKQFVEQQVARLWQRSAKVDEHFFERISDSVLGAVEKHVEMRHLRAYEKELLDAAETRAAQSIGERLRAKAVFAAYVTRAYFDAELFVIDKGDNVPES